MAKQTITEVYEAHFRHAVKAGGGKWVGIQEIEEADYDLVLFNSPTTGSTLALKSDNCTSEKVAAHIAESDRRFSHAKA